LSVSIVIPAFRPTFLRQTIASALTQGLEDFELIISDDSGGDALLPIVEQFRDPRIRYLRTAGRTGARENCRKLWGEARWDRVLFLLDDDLLAPHAVVELAAQLDARPDAAFAFAQRYLIDHRGRIIMDPPPPRASPMVVDHELMVRGQVGQVKNLVGELSNILINRAVGLTVDDLLTYRDYDIQVMGDVAFFLNATRKGPAVGISVPVGAFRRHEEQMSSPEFNPKLWLILGEWELFIRGEVAAGTLRKAEAISAAEKVREAYGRWAATVPQTRDMVPGIEELIRRLRRGDTDVLDDAFRADLARFVGALAR
jgi:glycosyltransferase involved in cell wall biosynthesis